MLLANGAPAESYHDDGNRWLFHNANSGWNLPPQAPCAPVLTGGPVVDAIWRRLLDRAGRPGRMPTTDEPDVHLVADGRRIDGRTAERGIHRFRLPRGATQVRVVSRAGVPSEVGLARDPRPAGRRRASGLVRWQAPHGVASLAAADAAAASTAYHDCTSCGQRPALDEWRREPTGDDVRRRQAGAVELELHVAATARYPLFARRSRPTWWRDRTRLIQQPRRRADACAICRTCPSRPGPTGMPSAIRFSAFFHCGSPATITGCAGSTGFVARRSPQNCATSLWNSSASRNSPGSIAMKKWPISIPCGFFVCSGSVISVAPDRHDARMFTIAASPYPL